LYISTNVFGVVEGWWSWHPRAWHSVASFTDRPRLAGTSSVWL